MTIADLRLTGLTGGTVEGGWAEELVPDDNVHTIVEVLTSDGRVGLGSVFTSSCSSRRREVASAAAHRRTGRRTRPRQREAPPEHLLARPRWGREHAISGIDIALWDLFGQITNQPVSRLLGGNYRNRIKPYGSLLFDYPDKLREKLKQAVARGFKAIKLGWKPFGRVDAKLDELLIRTARETVGPGVEIMVDAGGSDAYWPHGFKWALRTAQMLASYDVVWFEEAFAAGRFRGLRGTPPARAAPDHDGRGAYAASEFQAAVRTAVRGHRAARLHEVRRAHRSVANRVDGL